jgi:hypothetical protein
MGNHSSGEIGEWRDSQGLEMTVRCYMCHLDCHAQVIVTIGERGSVTVVRVVLLPLLIIKKKYI